MRIILMIFYLTLVILGVSFAALNATLAPLNLYFTELKIPVSVIVAFALSLGILFGVVIFLFKYWRLKLEHHRVKHQLKLMEKEVANLRAIPLQNRL